MSKRYFCSSRDEKEASLVLAARRTELLDTLANEITLSGVDAVQVTIDLTKRKEVKVLVDLAVAASGISESGGWSR